MKNLFVFLFSVAVFLSASTPCYAGDIPESLLYSDASQVYFGEIKSIDGERITVIQKEKIKGDFVVNREITYREFSFTDGPEPGEIYLLGYYDDNNPLYVWEVTGLDTKTLKIKNRDALSKRMQEYLNDGSFDQKEAERLQALEEENAAEGLSDAAAPDAPVQADQTEAQNESETAAAAKTNAPLRIALPPLVFVVLLGVAAFIRKRRKN